MATAAAAAAAAAQRPSLRRLIFEFGPVAFATYTAISCISFPGWIAAVHFGVDVPSVLSQFNQLSAWWSGPMKDPQPSLPTPSTSVSPPSNNSTPADNQSDFYTRFGSSVLIALAAHHLILPLRIGLTAALTPVAARYRIRIMQYWAAKRRSVPQA